MSHSGLVHRLGKAAGSKGSREFESLHLRKTMSRTRMCSEIVFLRESGEIRRDGAGTQPAGWVASRAKDLFKSGAINFKS